MKTGVIDAAHLERQREWSLRTFGPGTRLKGVREHILKEIDEAAEDPTEWRDVVILALDGAWRAGLEPQQIIDLILEKQAINEARVWPDWRTFSPDKAIEHVRPHPGNRPLCDDPDFCPYWPGCGHTPQDFGAPPEPDHG